MDLAIRFPAQGRIHLESRFLFAEPWRTELPSVRRTRIPGTRDHPGHDSQSDRIERSPAPELGFCARTYTLKQVIERVKDSLSPRKNSSNGIHQSNGHSHVNGHAHSNGQVSQDGGQTIAHPSVLEPLGVPITSVTPVRDSRGEVRYFRYGTIVTHWEIKHELPGRLRLRNPVIHRKAEFCQVHRARADQRARNRLFQDQLRSQAPS